MQQRAVLGKDNGFTMIEVIMAVLILMVGMLGLLQAINLATEVNLRNQIREESVYLGERVMNEMRGKGFDNISVATIPTQTFTYRPYSTQSRMRGVSRKYGVQRSSTVLSTQNLLPVTKQLEVVITWSYKGVGYQNRVVAPISILR
jgi:type IV pilus assembly protein PilV